MTAMDMKNQIKWLSLVLAFVTAIAISIGCGDPAHESVKPIKLVLSDTILAIGYPDKALSTLAGKENLLALLGKKHTYMLYSGGEEMEQITRLKTLDFKRLRLEPDSDYYSFREGNQVWGFLNVKYLAKDPLPEEVEAELSNGGFRHIHPTSRSFDAVNPATMIKWIWFEGVSTPVIKLTDEQMEKITSPRAFAFYAPGENKPPLVKDVIQSIAGLTVISVEGTIDKEAFGLPVVEITTSLPGH